MQLKDLKGEGYESPRGSVKARSIWSASRLSGSKVKLNVAAVEERNWAHRAGLWASWIFPGLWAQLWRVASPVEFVGTSLLRGSLQNYPVLLRASALTWMQQSHGQWKYGLHSPLHLKHRIKPLKMGRKENVKILFSSIHSALSKFSSPAAVLARALGKAEDHQLRKAVPGPCRLLSLGAGATWHTGTDLP